jgi:8-oxo-dGTP pyrophosphatase MutT (NUDIX family)
MSDFSKSYLGQLRQLVGSRLILMPGARLVLHDASRVFLQKRTDFGRWALISGLPEEGESITDMIVREAQEEAGITIERPTAFGYTSDPVFTTMSYPNGDRCQYFVMMFACDKFTGEPCVADSESTDAGWFAFDNLPSDCMPSAVATVKAFAAWRATGVFRMLE